MAVSDALGITAQGLDTVYESNMQKVASRLTAMAAELGAGEFVVGFPKNMNGTVGERGIRTQEFAKLLNETSGLPVTLWDERLTSVSAQNILKDSARRVRREKGNTDKISAVLILQGYMEKQNITNMGGNCNDGK